MKDNTLVFVTALVIFFGIAFVDNVFLQIVMFVAAMALGGVAQRMGDK